jgi:hypothetical protein
VPDKTRGTSTSGRIRGTSTQSGVSASGGYRAPATFTGTVSEFDAKTGRVSLSSNGMGTLDNVKVPSDTRQGLHQGQRVAVQITFAKGTPAGGGTSTSGSGGGGAH